MQLKGVKVLANRRRRSRGVLSWQIGGRRLGIPLWAFALVVAMIGVAAGQAGTERVNALLAGFLLMPGESTTITITNPRMRWACRLQTQVLKLERTQISL